MSEKHPLHRELSKNLNEKFTIENLEIINDPACGGNQHIPLFLSSTKSNDTKICNVDCLMIYKNQIKVILEIDESNVKPTHVLGKFMTSAISKYYIHDNSNNEPVEMSENVLFIQILSSKKLKPKSKKPEQWSNIENRINAILPSMDTKIKYYKVFYSQNDEIDYEEIRKCIVNVLKI